MATLRTVKDVEKDPRVKEIYKEDDEGFAGYKSSWWVYLTRGYCWDDDGLHTIHEATLKKVIECLGQVRTCHCESCEVRSNPRQKVIDLDSPATIAKVNTLLAACGREERLIAGKRGHEAYFWEGEAPGWYSTSIDSAKVAHLTVRSILESFELLPTHGTYGADEPIVLMLDGKPLLSTQWRTR
jgi:hypothetical protein